MNEFYEFTHEYGETADFVSFYPDLLRGGGRGELFVRRTYKDRSEAHSVAVTREQAEELARVLLKFAYSDQD